MSSLENVNKKYMKFSKDFVGVLLKIAPSILNDEIR